MSVPGPARRIVSLVPSLTESLFALGLGGRVVGVTDWCVHPADDVAALPRVGGTKNPDVERIAALRPDLVIANREENTRRTVDALRARGLRVWVTYPRTVRDAVALLREMGGLGADPEVLERVVGPIEEAFARAEAERPERPTRFFCPIWRDPWMAVGADTYAHDLLTLCGGKNVFADRRERRYPVVTLDDVARAAPEVILLPDEPYRFGVADAEELAALPVPAAEQGRIHLVDGTWVSWYGPRIGQAMAQLGRLLRPPA